MRTKISVFLFMLLLVTSSELIALNNCLSFDGVNDYVYCGNDINDEISNEITLSAWIYPEFNAYGDRGYITNYWYDGGIKGGAGIFAWTTTGDNHKFTGFISTQSGAYQQLSSPNEITLNQWTHVALTYDNSTARLYINGEEVVTSNCGPGYLQTPVNNNQFYIAKHSYSNNYNNCKMDEVQIWNSSRSSEEIKYNMYKTLDGNEEGLVAYYQFNQSEGLSLIDLTSNGFNGTLANMDGSEWESSLSLRNQSNALEFDGATEYVILDDRTMYSGLSALTVEAWVYPTASSGWREIFQVNPNNITLALSGSNLYSFVNSNDSSVENHYSISIGNAVEINKWNHVAMTWDSSTGIQILYANGEEIGRITNASTNALVAATGGPFIGTLAGTTEMYLGKMDELRVWNYIRSASELRENMCKTLTGNESGLINYFVFDQTQGSYILDISDSNNHGTLINMDDSNWIDSEAFTTWTGEVSTSWAEEGNWTDGVPTSTDNVGLYSGINNLVISGAPTISYLVIGNSVTTTLSSGITVNGKIILGSNLDLNGQIVSLGESATLLEVNGHVYGTTGTITTTRNLSGISEDVAGLGLEVTENDDLGECTITRGHTVQGTQSISRFYHIDTSNAPSNATMVFNYLDSELNGQDESELKLFKSEDSSTWLEQGTSTIDTNNNTITLEGINGFSYWTAAPTGSDSALPVTLSMFSAAYLNSAATIKWMTQCETSNAGWNIYRSVTESFSDAILENEDLIIGAGTSSVQTNYSFIDPYPVIMGCDYWYWLESISYCGELETFGPITLSVPNASPDETPNIPICYGLLQNYPNPFNPDTQISFNLEQTEYGQLNIYNVKGELVKHLYRGMIEKDRTYNINWNGTNNSGKEVQSGLYFYQLQTASYSQIEKMLMIK